jgi:type II restriction enzyme
MAKKDQLRQLRAGTVINATSKGQEKEIIVALRSVEKKLKQRYSVNLDFIKDWHLKNIVEELRRAFPDVDFVHHFDKSSIRPDGGILFLMAQDGKRFPILIGEVKNQGTNDRRRDEGLKKQAKGNAIERLGKNVIGLRTALLTETIFPFVCFGFGCDFTDDSSILDRVVTIAMFGHLNKTHLHQQGPNGEFKRGSFYFRENQWTVSEMEEVMFDIASRSVQYYFSKYGERQFVD